MRIHLISDLHYEYHRDDGASTTAAIAKAGAGADVLVIAGDLAPARGCLEESLARFCAAFSQVVYVPGNHEFYGSTREEVRDALAAATSRHGNLHVLDDSTATVCGRLFVGSTLWVPRRPATWHLRENISDFSVIRGVPRPATWMPLVHDAAAAFLRRAVKPGCIVVTHHMPSFAAVAPRWRGSLLNAFFACDDLDDVLAAGAALWLCGHTHDPVDTVAAGTRIVAAPCGYPNEGRAPVYTGRRLELP